MSDDDSRRRRWRAPCMLRPERAPIGPAGTTTKEETMAKDKDKGKGKGKGNGKGKGKGK